MKQIFSSLPKPALVIGGIAILAFGIFALFYGYRMGKEMAIRENTTKSSPATK